MFRCTTNITMTYRNCILTSNKHWRTWNIQDSCHLYNIYKFYDIQWHWNSWIALPSWHGNMSHCPSIPYQWYSVAGWYYLTSKLIVIFQIVVSNRAGGQRTGPGGWLLVSWWVWRILPSSLQVSRYLTSPWGQHPAVLLNWRTEKPSSLVWSVLVVGSNIFETK